MRRALVLAAALQAACYESRLVECSDGRLCPANTVCVDPALGGCVEAERSAACSGKADGDSCQFAAFEGICLAGVCVDSDGPRSKLLWAAPGQSMLEYAPIGSEFARAQPPTIQVGALGRPVVMAPYNASDGSFIVPSALVGSPYRILYTIPGDSIPHEIQWSLATATIVEPRTTRIGAPRPPLGSGYLITPDRLASAPAAPALATSGAYVFDDDPSRFDLAGPQISYYFASATPLLGPVGAPEAGRGDWVLVADWIDRSPAQRSVSGFAITSLDLETGTLSAPGMEPTWDTTTRTRSTASMTLPAVPTNQTNQRLLALGGLATVESRELVVGMSPDLRLPGLVAAGPPRFGVRPLLVPLVRSTSIDTSVTYADPSNGLGLDTMVFARIGRSRTVAGVTLTSSLHGITQAASTSVQFPVPLATVIELGGTDLGPTGVDGDTHASSSSPAQLTFSHEDGFTADDFVVTLFEVSAGTLLPLRTFQVLAPSVEIDPALLASGRSYVFSISARKGHPGAAMGDYRVTTLPYAASVVFSRLFVVE